MVRRTLIVCYRRLSRCGGVPLDVEGAAIEIAATVRRIFMRVGACTIAGNPTTYCTSLQPIAATGLASNASAIPSDDSEVCCVLLRDADEAVPKRPNSPTRAQYPFKNAVPSYHLPAGFDALESRAGVPST